jgi:hypothetical protein
MTYRENIANLLKPLRRIQLVSLILILLGFVLPFFGWKSNVILCGKILMLIGLVGEFYCWAKAKQIKCPQCGKSLGYLLHDPSYSKTSGVLLLPKELPRDIHCCAYCKASFDEENLIELYLNLCQKCNYGENMQAINEHERVVYVTQLLEAEVNNGGFDQFFRNSSGNLSKEIVAAFTRIGAVKTAAICEKAISVFPSPVPATQEERNRLLTEETEAILDKYDDEFYHSEENLDALNKQYIKEYKAWFRI